MVTLFKILIFFVALILDSCIAESDQATATKNSTLSTLDNRDCVGNSSVKCKLCTDGHFGNNCELNCSNECLKCFASSFNTSESACTVCNEGYFLFRNNCVKCANKCKACTTFSKCTKCTPGFYGTFCTRKCRDECLECTSKDSCTKCKENFLVTSNCRCSKNCIFGGDLNTLCYHNGTCVQGCVDGKMGEKCSFDCPVIPNCLACDRDDGRCTKCAPGWYNRLQYCSNQCGLCFPDSEEKIRCNDSNGFCYGECFSGFFGKKCDKKCSTNCLQYDNDSQICDQLTGHCKHCVTGQYGNFCQFMCSENCFVSENGTNICDQGSGECRGCKKGFFGKFCSRNCSFNCLSESSFDTCNISTGKCHQCKLNFYGDFCEKECFKNCDTCDKNTGVCNNCKGSFYGDSCNFMCPKNCSTAQHLTNRTVCQRETGECLNCKPGSYGKICDKMCPRKCGKYFSELTVHQCVKSNGQCINCEPGYYGTFCELTCSKTCKKINNFGERSCAQTNGRCMLGCIDGWHGMMCQHMCNTTCRDRACDSRTAQCSKECIDGYEGQYCERKQIYIEPQPFENITVNEGVFIEDINCVSICAPVCIIGWTRSLNGMALNDRKSSILHLDRAFRQAAGTYTCLVKDSRISRTFSKNVTVNIRYGPDQLRILPIENYLSIPNGEKAPLVSCHANCYPSCVFQWTKQNNNTSIFIVNNDTLHLGRVTRNHSGLYTCTVKNSAKEYPKSDSLSLVIEITEETVVKTWYSLPLAIGGVSISAVVLAVIVGVTLVKCKQRRNSSQSPVYDECLNTDELTQTGRTSAVSNKPDRSVIELYDCVVQDMTGQRSKELASHSASYL